MEKTVFVTILIVVQTVRHS